MSVFQSFAYQTPQQLLESAGSLGIDLPFDEDLAPLKQGCDISPRFRIKNRLAVQPIGAVDASADGRPGELTHRRYRRFSEGGSGVIWAENTAVSENCRSYIGEFILHEGTAEDFARLVETVNVSAKDGTPYKVVQLTHDGRKTVDAQGRPSPVRVCPNPYLDRPHSDIPILSDDDLKRIEDDFETSAKAACKAGFDCVEIKACHGYLVSELLSAFKREGIYGGGFEGRSRFLLDVVDRIRAAFNGKIDIAVRINAFDLVPQPYGFGADENGGVHLDEPVLLCKRLHERGVRLINVSGTVLPGTSWIVRPQDRPAPGRPEPSEHPLESIARLLNATARLQAEIPGALFVLSGLTWLREYGANVAAASVRRNMAAFAGFARQALAYPDFAADIVHKKGMERRHCCKTCSGCDGLLLARRPVGCVVFDRQVYGQELI